MGGNKHSPNWSKPKSSDNQVKGAFVKWPNFLIYKIFINQLISSLLYQCIECSQ